jgi:hypothetical protein
MKALHSKVSSSSNISSIHISSGGRISNRIEEEQKQANEDCPVGEKAQIDRSVMILESTLPEYAGVKWKLISFARKTVGTLASGGGKGRRSVQFTQYPGSDKWEAGESWLQGQYTKENCAVSDGQCLCRSEIFGRNFDDWTLEKNPCEADWPPGPIVIGTQLTAAPPGWPAVPLEVKAYSELDDYGQHPDGCPKKKAIIGTGESNRKKFQFLWKDGDLIVLSPGFICDQGHHMVNSILEGSSKMCNDAEENCRFGMIDAAAVTCNGDTKEWENFPTCVPNY